MVKQTSLEALLDKHKITRYSFIQMIDPLYALHPKNVWYDMFSGKRFLQQKDKDAITVTLSKLHTKNSINMDSFSFSTECKYLIV